MRSKFSNWVYRVFITLVLIASYKSAQFAYAMFAEANSKLTGTVWATALYSVMGTSILLLFIAISLLCRSGASVWLTGWLFISAVAPVLITAFGSTSTGGAFLLLAIASIVVLIVAGVLVYLIKTNEIRRP